MALNARTTPPAAAAHDVAATTHAAPAAAIDSDPGQKVVLVVSYHAGRKRLPVIKLKRVA